jgi:hypothetical protein
MSLAAARRQLHDLCAIYTSAPIASRLLDTLGWMPEIDLSKSVLLEPCVGEGAILIEAVRRLVASFRKHRHSLRRATLLPRIKGYEFYHAAAKASRREVRCLLTREGVSWATASKLAEAWVVERDFLLENPGRATHIAANPPYLRWSKLPEELALLYRKVLPSEATRGDASVAFLHRMQEWAGEHGAIATLVSDRWLYAQYGEEFVAQTTARGWSICVVDERPADPFVRKVGAYSAIISLTRTGDSRGQTTASSRCTAQTLHRRLVERYGTLDAAGCRVRVGPALGAGRTFVVNPDEKADVEPELLRYFVERRDLAGPDIVAPRLRVIVPYDRSGQLIDLNHWPRFAAWAAARKDALAARSQFVNSDHYWRTIDAVSSQWSPATKLLLPELCNKPKTVIDRSGAIPGHSIYAIWSDEWPIEALQNVLNAGLLELTAEAEAPRLKLGWLRFYKRFLIRTPLPKWSSLSQVEQNSLMGAGAIFAATFHRLFEFHPGEPPIK